MGATTVINLMIMSLWNYIGEFLLFRWLFGSHEHNETKRDLSDKSASFGNDTHTGFGRSHDNSYSRYDNRDYGYSQSYDDFHDEQDDYDMMDNDF